jgi:alpha-galactosidase
MREPIQLLRAVLRYEDQRLELNPGKMTFHEALYAEFTVEEKTLRPGVKGQVYSIMLHPKRAVRVEKLELEFAVRYSSGDRIFCNGFQSWTETRNFSTGERIPDMNWLLRPFAERLGDYRLLRDGDRSPLHAWTCSYIERAGGGFAFWGGTLERSGWTLVRHEPETGICRVEKDLRGLTLEHSFPAFDCLVAEGNALEPLLKLWADARENTTRPPARKILGWTSWYRHYTRIDESVVTDNLRALRHFREELPEELARPERADWVFQIDDGWQETTGDWALVRSAFPKGMGAAAEEIRKAGFLPGLWMAPFAVSEHSKLYRKYPDWLLRDAKGKPLRVGYNPYWKGWYGALDFYRKDVQDYVASIIWQAREQWGFSLLKLDFLFAAALAPPPHKTRGQAMYDAMAFLRECAGPARILACGVPLGSAFGLVDYCRIGPDVHLSWEHRLLKWLGARERLDTRQSLVNTFARRFLDQTAFRIDPDVVVLREKGHRLRADQRQHLLTVNTLLGSVLFTSDHFGELSGETRTKFAAAIDVFLNAEVLSAECSENGRYALSVAFRGRIHRLEGQL